MKIPFIILSSFISLHLIAQPGDVSNSFKKTYATSFSTLTYSYDPATQTHNYSGNWDIDGDKKPDSVLFIGNGGAHLYFHLQLKLSSESKARDFPNLLTDFPMLDSISHFKKVYTPNQLYPAFVVHDFNDDGKMDIYLNTDIKFAPIPPPWKRKGITLRNLLITYEKKEIVIRNFPGFTD